ncbi:hypothetical protein EV193_101605 [Herbihabitans rhizosphaerae]|uniref:Uncharacterized protein n=1 Tax=Herbihabitans rhizosphaerae TaxID=1872711 RepID=A0A4Q7L510_9PSEU|nr:hypothetical protein [Herbihabitans rhizosphaerae]RZS44728.1 hypothetical protein EV193_101605 [Herbihabitans rhizosphaerae]
MSASNFRLGGPGIEIEYTTDGDELTVRGHGNCLERDGKSFAGKEISRMTTGYGELVTVTLLDSSRNQTAVRLAVLMPRAVLTGEDGKRPVTGVGMITRDYREVLGGAPPVRHDYDVRPLSGTMWA